MIRNRLHTSARPILDRPAWGRTALPRSRVVVFGLFWTLGLTALAGPSAAPDVHPNSGAAVVERVDKAIEPPVYSGHAVYDSRNRRDPFLNPIPYRKQAGKLDDEEVDRGLAPPGIAGTYIAKAILQGVSMQDSGRVAVVRGADGRAYFVREGDRLFDGYVKRIDSDSIIMVRETPMKSGKTLTQDVTKWLRTP